MDIKSAKDVLVLARPLIANGFITGAYAKTKDGTNVAVDDERAVCFCSLGAIRNVFYKAERAGTSYELMYEAEECLINAMNDYGPVVMGVITYNDSHTKEEVLAKWDKAIATC